jgi:hypothetical protein
MLQETLLNLWKLSTPTPSLNALMGSTTATLSYFVSKQFFHESTLTMQIWRRMGLFFQTGVISYALCKMWTEHLNLGMPVPAIQRHNLYGFLAACGGYWAIDFMLSYGTFSDHEFHDWEETHKIGAGFLLYFGTVIPTELTKYFHSSFLGHLLEGQHQEVLKLMRASKKDPEKIAEALCSLMALSFDVYDLRGIVRPAPQPSFIYCVAHKKGPPKFNKPEDLGLELGQGFFDYYKDKSFSERHLALSELAEEAKKPDANYNRLLIKEMTTAAKVKKK